MKKGLISIFALPYEIDALHTTLYNLRRNAELLSDDIEFGFDITLCVSDTMTDWSKSKLPKEYFTDKLYCITDMLCGWATKESVGSIYDDSILGCVSQRRNSLKFVDNYDFTVWLDTDLFFGDKFLGYLESAVNSLSANNIEYYVITPQITRQWDTSWDVLVNAKLLGRELNDNLTSNVFDIGLKDFGPVNIIPITGFKAAGGWATTISNKLLKVTGIPNSLGHYGLEDTYVLSCADMLQKTSSTIRPIQCIIENLVIGENHSGQSNEYLKNNLHSINRKDEFRKIATDNFNNELEKFYQSINK